MPDREISDSRRQIREQRDWARMAGIEDPEQEAKRVEEEQNLVKKKHNSQRKRMATDIRKIATRLDNHLRTKHKRVHETCVKTAIEAHNFFFDNGGKAGSEERQQGDSYEDEAYAFILMSYYLEALKGGSLMPTPAMMIQHDSDLSAAFEYKEAAQEKIIKCYATILTHPVMQKHPLVLQVIAGCEQARTRDFTWPDVEEVLESHDQEQTIRLIRARKKQRQKRKPSQELEPPTCPLAEQVKDYLDRWKVRCYNRQAQVDIILVREADKMIAAANVLFARHFLRPPTSTKTPPFEFALVAIALYCTVFNEPLLPERLSELISLHFLNVEANKAAGMIQNEVKQLAKRADLRQVLQRSVVM